MTKSIQLTGYVPTVSASRTTALTGHLWAVPGRLLRRVLAARQHRLAMQELHALDDRMLNDIGIDRASIPWVARHGRDIM